MTPDQVMLLDDVAASWVGTPWCDNSATKGKGACCHLLVAAIYREAGWFDCTPPKGIATSARWANNSPIRDWLRGDGRQWFLEVPKEQPVIPGDALLIKVGHVPHHLVMVLSDHRMIHVTHQQGVQIAFYLDNWSRHLDSVFRPR